eukprot:CAMPEP_0170452752 /NCGR_PEP_ID=MMETSP0123-20130129/1542_1 /TAXON_ID=182087 /ORGANISM="Favella ehrenbergii, Strain Fehren 1" /LENGTH=85 /DNA_ID=CAMNT_0010714855 /DNA_START=485 /DNA_END=742 /DNA_ORIENTATION=-
MPVLNLTFHNENLMEQNHEAEAKTNTEMGREESVESTEKDAFVTVFEDSYKKFRRLFVPTSNREQRLSQRLEDWPERAAQEMSTA